jgi:hypothetical protein
VSQPFAHLVSKRVALRSDKELTEVAFEKFNRWAGLSSDKMVPLDEVAWVAALMVKAVRSAGIDLLHRHETRDENGARVVGVVASDGVDLSDNAG